MKKSKTRTRALLLASLWASFFIVAGCEDVDDDAEFIENDNSIFPLNGSQAASNKDMVCGNIESDKETKIACLAEKSGDDDYPNNDFRPGDTPERWTVNQYHIFHDQLNGAIWTSHATITPECDKNANCTTVVPDDFASSAETCDSGPYLLVFKDRNSFAAVFMTSNGIVKWSISETNTLNASVVKQEIHTSSSSNQISHITLYCSGGEVTPYSTALVYGDPHFIGADGEHFDFHGVSGHFYSIMQVENSWYFNAQFKKVRGRKNTFLHRTMISIPCNGGVKRLYLNSPRPQKNFRGRCKAGPFNATWKWVRTSKAAPSLLPLDLYQRPGVILKGILTVNLTKRNGKRDKYKIEQVIVHRGNNKRKITRIDGGIQYKREKGKRSATGILGQTFGIGPDPISNFAHYEVPSLAAKWPGI